MSFVISFVLAAAWSPSALAGTEVLTTTTAEAANRAAEQRPTPSPESATYASREARAQNLDKFEGGGTAIYLSSGAAVVLIVLLVLLIVL